MTCGSPCAHYVRVSVKAHTRVYNVLFVTEVMTRHNSYNKRIAMQFFTENEAEKLKGGSNRNPI